MRIFFSDIQKCDVWIIYCCNKLLWLWIYIYYFFSMRVRRKTVTNMIFIFNDFCVISFVLWTFLFPKMAIQEEKCLQICYVYLKRNPQVISFVFHFKQLWVFALWMLGSTVWRGSTYGTKNLQFLFFISSSLFHHQDFPSHFEIKILPINFTEKKILK